MRVTDVVLEVFDPGLVVKANAECECSHASIRATHDALSLLNMLYLHW